MCKLVTGLLTKKCKLFSGRDKAVSRHFCPDKEKQRELFELILGNLRMGFSNKIQVFESLALRCF